MLNLGGLFFTLDADTRGLINAQRRIERFANDVRSAFRGVGAGTVAPNIANQLARQERAVISMMERIKRVQNTVNASGFKGEGLQKAQLQLEILGRQYDTFTRKMASGIPLNSLDFGRRVQHMTSQINDATRAVNNLQKETLNSKTAWGNATGFLHSLGLSALVVQGHFGGLSTRLIFFGNLVRETGFAVAATTSVLAGLGTGIGLLGAHAVSSGRALERLTVGFNALTGNAAVTGLELDYVRKVADQAGLSFEDTAKGYQRFLASAQGVISLDKTRQVFRGISLAAATMQLSVEDTQGVFRALDQMMSKGTVQAEELRGQLGDRLPGAFKIAAAAMGVTTRQLGEMMKKGQVVSSEFVPKFTQTLMRMWNIDPSKNMDTLQASIGRLGTAWVTFGQELDRVTGASRLFKEAVDLLVRGLQGVQASLPSIIAGMGALAGGFTALATAMAIQGLVSYVTTMWNLVAVYNTATRAIMLGATAVNVFNAAMTRIPAAKVIGLIANLVITIGGAVIGYKMMEEAIGRNNAALNDISAINAYINAQKAMGFQVATTTQEMIKQLQVQTTTQSAALMKSVDDMKQVAQDFGALQGVMAEGGRGAAAAGSGYGILQKKFHDSLTTVREGTKSLRQMEQALRGLQDVSKLPNQPIVPQVAGGGGAAGDTSKIKDSIDRFDDLILKMREAESMMQSLADAPGARNLIESLFEARRAINNLNPTQIMKLSGALDKAGISGGNLEERLAVVINRTKEAEDSIKGFTKAFDDIRDAARAVKTFEGQLAFLKGGGDQYGLDFFRDLQDAFDRIKDIREPAALKALQTELSRVGVEIKDTGDLAYDTAMGMAQFYNQASRTQDLVRVWSQFNETIRSANNGLVDLQVTLNAYRGGDTGMFGRMFGAALGEEVNKALDRGRKVEEEKRRLLGLGESWDTVRTKLTDYLNTLRGIDATSEALARNQKAAEETRDALKSMVETGSNGFRDWIRGATKLKDVLLDLANNALNSVWQRFVTNPLDNLIDSIGQKGAKKQTSGLDAMVAGLAPSNPANDNAKAVGALGAAAEATAGIMKGSLIGSLIQATTSTIASTTATASETAATAAKTAMEAANLSQLTMININLTLFNTALTQATGALIAMAAAAQANASSSGASALAGLGSIFSAAPGRATGGPMLAGNLYQINEPGIAGEYFIPSVSGYMSRSAPANSNGGVMIDARTTIDARGATSDMIAQLRVEMATRDARLRQELPYMVDSRVMSSGKRGRYDR